MSKIKAKNTLYNDPMYDIVVDSRMLEQSLKEKDQQIAELQKQLDEKTKTIQGLIEVQKYLEESASYQMFLDIQKQLEEKDVDIIALDTDNYSFKQQIDNLRQQLKSQLAEIVKKIKKRLCDRLNIIAGYGQMTVDEFSFFIESEFTKDIDEILKEYGEEK